jgi:hypothetical protein
VTDNGDKLALDPLYFPLPADVLYLHHEITRRACAIPHERHAEQRPDGATTFVVEAFLHSVPIDLSGKRLPDALQIGLEIVNVGDTLKIIGQQLVLVVAEKLAQGGVDFQKAAIRCDERHSDRGALHGATKGFLAGPQRFQRNMVAQCGAQRAGQEAQHVLHVRVKRCRHLTHDLQYPNCPSGAEQGRTDHRACTYSAASIPVDPGIVFGVLATQNAGLGDTEPGEAAGAAQP